MKEVFLQPSLLLYKFTECDSDYIQRLNHEVSPLLLTSNI